MAARENGIESRTERIHVVPGLGRRRVGDDELRSHIGRRAGKAMLSGRAGGLSEPPVEDQDLAMLTQHDVVRFDVAVNDVLRMGKRQCVADPREDTCESLDRIRRSILVSAGYRLGEGGAADLLHREPRPSIRRYSTVVHGDDTRVLEACTDLRLRDEAVAGRRIVDSPSVQHLHRHGSMEKLVLNANHRAHAAVAEDGDESVPAPFIELATEVTVDAGGCRLTHASNRQLSFRESRAYRGRITRRRRHARIFRIPFATKGCDCSRIMGVLEHGDGSRRTLGNHNVLGRSPAATVELRDKRASAVHAAVTWRHGGWHIRDLGSRNGTALGGRRLDVGIDVPLARGAEIALGTGRETWRLTDDRPPSALARKRSTEGLALASDGLIAIPTPEDPRVCLYRDEDGGWWLEDDEGTHMVQDQTRLDVAGEPWVVEVPSPESSSIPTTQVIDASARVLQEMAATFRVSLDGEHVELQLGDDLGTLDFGARAHHDVLLVLARARIDDRARGLAGGEGGWLYVDDAATRAGIDPQHLTVAVFRARKQIAEAGVLNAGALIERRPRPRQMRFGVERTTILTPRG